MNPSTPPQQLDGRTVRDIVEYNHELVSEPWCRRIIRQVLQSLEVQYGMNVPHRRITPDSLHILEAGDPMLVPGYSELPDTAVPADYEARDLYDLAAVKRLGEGDAPGPGFGVIKGRWFKMRFLDA